MIGLFQLSATRFRFGVAILVGLLFPPFALFAIVRFMPHLQRGRTIWDRMACVCSLGVVRMHYVYSILFVGRFFVYVLEVY